jgi:hypothetical protein
MPAPVISSLQSFITANLPQFQFVWEGEVPRQDPNGVNIVPENDFPVLEIKIDPGAGFVIQRQTEDAYDESGMVWFEIYDTTLASVESQVQQLYALFYNSSNWPNIITADGYFVFDMIPLKWTYGEEENVRTQNSSLLFKGELMYKMCIHGSSPSR